MQCGFPNDRQAMKMSSAATGMKPAGFPLSS